MNKEQMIDRIHRITHNEVMREYLGCSLIEGAKLSREKWSIIARCPSAPKETLTSFCGLCASHSKVHANGTGCYQDIGCLGEFNGGNPCPLSSQPEKTVHESFGCMNGKDGIGAVVRAHRLYKKGALPFLEYRRQIARARARMDKILMEAGLYLGNNKYPEEK